MLCLTALAPACCRAEAGAAQFCGAGKQSAGGRWVFLAVLLRHGTQALRDGQACDAVRCVREFNIRNLA